MDDIRQISTRLAMLERQAESLRMNLEMLQGHIRELMVARDTVKSIKDAKEGQEVLFPVGGGSYTFGKITDNSSVIINIGSDVAAKQGIDKAITMLEGRIEEMKGLLNKTSSSYSEVANAMAELEDKGRQLVEKQSQKK
ncbi:MAG: prefoldin subunit alpha [Candidatus Methanofastidiosa archaeon]|nr:prefoldin subunit alpha [Candidatus Methanofastidiosa archaeon]